MAQAKQSKVNPPPNYDFQFARDDAASTSSAISLRSNIGAEFADDEDHDDHDLPTYSDATGIEEAEVPLLAPEDLDETVDSWTHEDRNGSCNYTRLSPTLTTDPIALKKYLEYEAKIYPTAYIRIRGQHTETRRNGGNNNNKKEVVVDFDFRLDVTDTIARSHGRHRVAEWSSWSIVDHDRKTYRGTRLKAVNKNFRADVEATHSKASLDEWCHLFCASSSLLKSFTLRRHISNRNEAYIRDKITEYIRGTNYRGQITITFPLSYRTVTVISNHPFNRLRNNKFFYWFCIIFQLWIITWPILFFMTKRWSVLEVFWPYKICRVTENRPPEFQYVKDSEAQWCQRYEYTVKQAVLCKTKERETTFVAESSGRARELDLEQQSREREQQGGFVGGAIALARGLSNISRESDSVRGWGYDS